MINCKSTALTVLEKSTSPAISDAAIAGERNTETRQIISDRNILQRLIELSVAEDLALSLAIVTLLLRMIDSRTVIPFQWYLIHHVLPSLHMLAIVLLLLVRVRSTGTEQWAQSAFARLGNACYNTILSSCTDIVRAQNVYNCQGDKHGRREFESYKVLHINLD